MGLRDWMGIKRDRWFVFNHYEQEGYVQAYGRPDARKMLKKLYGVDDNQYVIAAQSLTEVDQPQSLKGYKRAHTPE